MKRMGCFFVIFMLLLGLNPVLGAGQTEEREWIRELYSLPAPTGYENPLIDKIEQMLPEYIMTARDELGSLYASVTEGKAFLTLASGVDETGYIAGGINSEGFISLDRVVPSPFPIFDSFFPGHSMTVWTEKGPVQGVLALPSTHILSRDARRNISEYFTIDNFYLDIGASSRLDAEASGVKFCDPVTVSQELQSLAGEKICGYGAGDRLSAAVLVDTIRRHSRDEILSGVKIVWLAQTKFFMRGSRPRKALGAVHSTKHISGQEILVIDVFPESEESRITLGGGPVFIPGSGTGAMKQRIRNAAEKHSVLLQEASEIDSPVLNAFKGGYASSALCLPVRYVHTPSEMVDFSDFKGLAEILSAVLMKEGI